MSKVKKLAKGLEEFAASISDIEYGPELIDRLLDLPANGLSEDVRDYKLLVEKVRQAEDSLASRKRDASEKAKRIWEIAAKNWTVEELQKATGYTEN